MKFVAIVIYDALLLAGTGYVVFGLHRSPLWFIVAALFFMTGE